MNDRLRYFVTIMISCLIMRIVPKNWM